MLVDITEEVVPGYEVTETVEIVTYDDCIAIMDASIALRLEEEDATAFASQMEENYSWPSAKHRHPDHPWKNRFTVFHGVIDQNGLCESDY